jgi:hemolysin activation/secretion protein
MRPANTILTTSILFGFAQAALAQQGSPPLQENGQRALREPIPSAPLPLPPPPPPMAIPPGGMTVVLKQVSISGNTLIAQDELLRQLGPVVGQTFDFAGLNALADKLSAYYRAAGYPFARAYLPQQELQQGALRIEVLEGRYGAITAHGDKDLSPGAQRFLSQLRPGSVIESHELERVTLILDDQPGVKSTPVVRPGKEVGTGDLAIEVQRAHRYAGEIGLDNNGTRYTGRTRAHASLDVDSPFTLGDQISLQGMYTNEQMWFGSAGYALPLGSSGLRGRLGYARSYYALADSFAALNATGTANVVSAGLSYPLVRSQRRNVTLSATAEHKRLRDRQGAVNGSSDKSSNSMPFAANFDMRDTLLRGGVTYGAISWTPGRLNLDDALIDADATTARSAGHFSKVNIDLARIQSVAEQVDGYARISGQWASKNLDSSQKFGLGGRNGVRAYPSGEGYGDAGALLQLEVRYATGALMPYLFYDVGRITTNRDPWTSEINHRTLAGAGLGMRYDNRKINASLIAAWRTRGGSARSEPHNQQPMLWLNAGRRF